MRYTPERICSLVGFIEGISDCNCMVKCKDKMSSLIGRFWIKKENRWTELPMKDWPIDVNVPEFANWIRWGELDDGNVQINIRSNGKYTICKSDGIMTRIISARVCA